jgi:hypothetical protein
MQLFNSTSFLYFTRRVYNLVQVANKLNIAKHMLYVSPTMIITFNIPVEYNFLNPLSLSLLIFWSWNNFNNYVLF